MKNFWDVMVFLLFVAILLLLDLLAGMTMPVSLVISMCMAVSWMAVKKCIRLAHENTILKAEIEKLKTPTENK